MQARTIPVPRQRLTRHVIAAFAVLASCAAWADDPNPYYIGISETLTHDTNVYLVPNGPSDNYSTTSLVGGFDQSIGRQRVYLAGTVGYNRYQDQTNLNNTSYNVNAGWDWATIERLSGSVRLYANQGLATLSGNSFRPTAATNILNTEQLSANLQWGGDSRLSVLGNYTYSRVNYSAPLYISSNSTGSSASAGLYYSVNPDIKVGAALRFTRTETPAYFIVPGLAGSFSEIANTADGRNLDLTVDWRLTAQTGINARLSRTSITNSYSGAQDFNGPTGAIYANYAPTAKLAFSAGYASDAGTYASFFNNPNAPPGTPVTGLRQYSQTNETFSLGVTYAATAKITANAGVQHTYTKYAFNSATNPDNSDNQRSATLGVNYVGAKHWSLGCNYHYLSRNTTGPSGYYYTDNRFGCYGQYTLR